MTKPTLYGRLVALRERLIEQGHTTAVPSGPGGALIYPVASSDMVNANVQHWNIGVWSIPGGHELVAPWITRLMWFESLSLWLAVNNLADPLEALIAEAERQVQ